MNNNLSYKNPFFIVTLIVIVVAIVGIIFVFVPKYSVPPQQIITKPFQLNESMTVPEKKETMLVRSRQASITPLTSTEKSAIFNELGGSKAQKYNLTPEEQQAILKALNGK